MLRPAAATGAKGYANALTLLGTLTRFRVRLKKGLINSMNQNSQFFRAGGIVARRWIVGSAAVIGAFAAPPAGDALVVAPAAAQELPTVTFTEAQAASGRSAYNDTCQGCHGANREGAEGPALKGEAFARWLGGPASELYHYRATTLPINDPGSLTPATYAALLAYILQTNGFTPGDQPLPADPEQLAGMRLTPPSRAGFPSGDFRPGFARASAFSLPGWPARTPLRGGPKCGKRVQARLHTTAERVVRAA